MSYVAHLLSTPIMEAVSDDSVGEMKFKNCQEKDCSSKIEGEIICNGHIEDHTGDTMLTDACSKDGEDCDKHYHTNHSAALENGDQVMDSEIVNKDNCEGNKKCSDNLEHADALVPIDIRTFDSNIRPGGNEALPECDILHASSNIDALNSKKTDTVETEEGGGVKSDSACDSLEVGQSQMLEVDEMNSDEAEPKTDVCKAEPKTDVCLDKSERLKNTLNGDSDLEKSCKESDSEEKCLPVLADSPKDLTCSKENQVDKENSRDSALKPVSQNDDLASDSNSDKLVRKKKTLPINKTTPRRSSRNLNKTKSYIDEIPQKSEEGVQDLSKNQSAESRKNKNNTIVVNDTKRLAEIAVGSRSNKSGKKEPTLVIIDTNSLIGSKGTSTKGLQGSSSRVTISHPHARSSWPINLSQSGVFHQKSVKVASLLSAPTPVSQSKPVILPSLTDDMFVVEAPSFIVPYVYEKPPLNTLKDYVKELGTSLKKFENKDISDSEEEAKRVSQDDLCMKTGEGENVNDSKTNVRINSSKSIKKEEDSNKAANCSDGKDQTEKPQLAADALTPKDEEKIDVEDTKNHANENLISNISKEQSVVNKEKLDSKDESIKDKVDIPGDKLDDSQKIDKTNDTNVKQVSSDNNKKLGEPDVLEDKTNKRTNNYFDNPLGKFFMQIGINLVQEHVQTDLLRSQQRKRDRDGKSCSPDVQMAIMSLGRTLQSSKENNQPFKFELKKCQMCNFKTESQLVMAHHLETPHIKNCLFRCSFCKIEVRNPHDILFHMESEHSVRGRLERTTAFHQCPNCPFEDNQKGKLSRHLLSCAKKYKPERNQEPPLEWEPPAKIPRMRGMSSGMMPSYPPAGARLVSPSPGAALSNQRRSRQPIYLKRYPPSHKTLSAHIRQGYDLHDTSLPSNTAILIGRGRKENGSMVFRQAVNNTHAPLLLPSPYQLSSTQMLQSKNVSNGAAAKLLQQPSISITPLPRSSASEVPSGGSISSGNSTHPVVKPGRPPGTTTSKSNFVICEICDGYIKDLEQLRNHMQWIHKVKIHPKMMYNRPPLNCQKCQFRFFTDQGLERHLLGSHGLVTSSMQEAANKGKDGGRCPVCGRVYQWKLLNHVARDHNMCLKPAHLSYKCTVCTATFGMYKQFENHVYSAHSVVAKKVIDKSKNVQSSSCSSQSDSPLKPLKINDEITIIPQPARGKAKAFAPSKFSK